MPFGFIHLNKKTTFLYPFNVVTLNYNVFILNLENIFNLNWKSMSYKILFKLYNFLNRHKCVTYWHEIKNYGMILYCVREISLQKNRIQISPFYEKELLTKFDTFRIGIDFIQIPTSSKF